MIYSIESRLRKLEANKPNNLIILYNVIHKDGTEKEYQGNVQEFLKEENAHFTKVLSGNSIDDIDLILARITTNLE